MLIKLDSSTLTGQDSHNFKVNFSPNLVFPDGKYECALVTANLWYSYYNVSSALGNNELEYSPDGGLNWNTVTIPDGNYSVEDINGYFQAVMKANGDYAVIAGADTFYLSLNPNYNTGRVVITASNSYELDLTTSTSPRDILGFSSQAITANTTGDSLADVTLGINSFMIHCNLVNGSSYENNITSDVLYTFVPESPPYSSIKVEPVSRLYLPITLQNVTTISIRITDQANNLIDLNGEAVTVLLDIRKRRD